MGQGDRPELEIRILDTGTGIPPDEQERIFECFEQEIRKEELLNQVQESRWGALHYACYFGHTEMVTVLVNQLVNRPQAARRAIGTRKGEHDT